MTRPLAIVGACAALAAGAGAQETVDRDPSCARTGAVVDVELDAQRHAHILDHARDAVRAGHPRTLHIARYEAEQNRERSLRGIPRRPGYDRDEYPPAVSDEGGAGASVRYARSSENRSAGSRMGRQLRPFCNGQRFRVVR